VTTDQLHTHAIEAEKHAEQLATGIAQIGADPAAVKAVTQCAALFRKIAVSLAKGGTQPAPQPTTDQAISNHFAQQRAAQAAPPAAAQPQVA